MNHMPNNERHGNVAARNRRRLRRISLCAVAALATGVSSAQAQVTVPIHSGNGAMGTPDSKVRITSDPAHPSAYAGRPADILASAHSYWHAPINASQWVSDNPQGDSSGLVGTTRYSIDIPLPYGATAASLTGSVYADDEVTVRVNNTSSHQLAHAVPTFSSSTWVFTNAPTPFTTTQLDPAAPKNTLTFDVGNSGGATGLDFDATLTYTPGPLGPPQLDHFKCYTVKPTSPKQRAVVLADQFGIKKSTVREVRELCNPVDKVHNDPAHDTFTSSDMSHPKAHLVCRRTVDHGGVPQRAVRLHNQFGVIDTVTTGSQTLCLPSLKRKLSGPHGNPPVGKNPEKVLDHFRCYGVKPRQVSVGKVKLSDQFGSGAVKVMQLVKLCNPVRKTFKHKVSKIKYKQAHLACYTIKDGMQFQPRWVSTRNQFGVRKLHVQKAYTLCLPTFKQLLPMHPIPAEAPLASEPTPLLFTASLTTTSCNQGENVVHTVKGTTTPAHPYGSATGVLSGGHETFPAQTVAVAADGTWSAQIKTPRTPATYSWDWEVTDINAIKAKASIALVVKAENPLC